MRIGGLQPPLDWLLEENDPSIRYFTLLNLLDRLESDDDVVKARGQVIRSILVERLAERQHPGGYWGKPEDFYQRSKYRGTVWTFLILAQLGVDGRDERIRKAADFLIERAQDRISGGFAYRADPEGGEHEGDHEGVIPCLTGNLVWAMIRLGYLDEDPIQAGIDWIATYQRFDDGENGRPEGWPYRYEKCWGQHTCMMGAVKALKALAEIPPEKQNPEVKAAIEQGSEFLLRHHLIRRSHDLAQEARPEWLQMGFPLFWDTDVLEMALILARLGCRDARMQPAMDWIASRREDSGCWLLERSFNGRCLVNIEKVGQPSKWVTLRALTALKWFNGL